MQRQKVQPDAGIGNFPEIRALLPKLVKAAPHRAAGPGVVRAPAPQQPACLMDMAEREIGKAGGRQLFRRNWVIGRGRLRRVPVEDHEVRPAVGFRAEALQQRSFVPRGEARAIDAQLFLRQLDCLDFVRFENMHVFRPALRQIRAAGQQTVVVAGADEDRRADGGQRPPERQQRLVRRARAVKQIARQQDKIAVVRVGRLGKLGQKLALLLPPRSSLFGAEGGKRRVQMQIGGMQKFNHGAPPFLPPCSGLSSRRW